MRRSKTKLDLQSLQQQSTESKVAQSQTLRGIEIITDTTETDELDFLEKQTENEEVKRLEPFVEYKKVQDKSIIGVKTNLVRIRDPCNGQLLAQIRDPKIAILPYQTMDGVIDIKDHIENRKLPHFYKGEVPLTFDN